MSTVKKRKVQKEGPTSATVLSSKKSRKMPLSSVDGLKMNMSSEHNKKAKTAFKSRPVAISLSEFLKAEEPIESTKARKNRSDRLQQGNAQSQQVVDSVQELQLSTEIGTRNWKGKARAISAPYIPTSNTTKDRRPQNTVPDAIPVSPKLLKRFYETLVILYILGANRASSWSKKSSKLWVSIQEWIPQRSEDLS